MCDSKKLGCAIKLEKCVCELIHLKQLGQRTGVNDIQCTSATIRDPSSHVKHKEHMDFEVESTVCM